MALRSPRRHLDRHGAGLLAADSGVERMDAGYTLPFQKVALRLESAGIVKSRDVKEGDLVKAGQVLLTLDDRKEIAELQSMELDASDIAVRAQKVNAEVKEAELKRIKHLLDNGGGNVEEYEKAKAEAELAALQITKEEQDILVKKKKIEKQQAVIDAMKLAARRMASCRRWMCISGRWSTRASRRYW